MKKSIKIIVSMVLMILTVSFATACKPKISKEDIVYNMICVVCADYDEEPENITVQAGTLLLREDGDYDAWVTIKVRSYTMYFYGTYFTKTGIVDYKDATNIVNSSIVGPGPCYLETQSFDIAEVNNRLRAN